MFATEYGILRIEYKGGVLLGKHTPGESFATEQMTLIVRQIRR